MHKKVKALVSDHVWNINGKHIGLEKDAVYTVTPNVAADMEKTGHGKIIGEVAGPVPQNVEPERPGNKGPKETKVIVPDEKKMISQMDLPEDLEGVLSRMQKNPEITAWAKENLGVELSPNVKKNVLIDQVLGAAAKLPAEPPEDGQGGDE